MDLWGWLVGISMGGFSALAYAKAHPREVAGLLLLAPFLGEEQTVAEIAAVGLRQWTPKEGRGPEDYTRRLWRWLKQYADSGAAELPLEIESVRFLWATKHLGGEFRTPSGIR